MLTPGPQAWCSEYASYVFDKATGGMINPNPHRSGKGSEGMEKYFATRHRFINATNTLYERLGDYIQPGYYVKIGRSGHSTIFVGWVRSTNEKDPDYKKGNWEPCAFNPDAKKNFFLAIGGNQVKKCVGLEIYCVTDEDPRDTHGPQETKPGEWREIIWIATPSNPLTGKYVLSDWSNSPEGTDVSWRDTPDCFGDTRINSGVYEPYLSPTGIRGRITSPTLPLETGEE